MYNSRSVFLSKITRKRCLFVVTSRMMTVALTDHFQSGLRELRSNLVLSADAVETGILRHGLLDSERVGILLLFHFHVIGRPDRFVSKIPERKTFIHRREDDLLHLSHNFDQ